MLEHRQPFWRSRQAIPVVFVHGMGADGREMEAFVSTHLAELDFPDSLLCFPTFEIPYMFLLPAADGKLIHFLNKQRWAGWCNGRCVLVGFSGGAQFAHRFALKHPEQVASAICLSAGCWTNPRGESYGMMVEEEWFKHPPWDTQEVAAALQAKAEPRYRTISWVIGCGTADLPSRVRSSRRFYQDLGAVKKRYFAYAEAHELPHAENALLFFTLLSAHIEAAAASQTTPDSEGETS